MLLTISDLDSLLASPILFEIEALEESYVKDLQSRLQLRSLHCRIWFRFRSGNRFAFVTENDTIATKSNNSCDSANNK